DTIGARREQPARATDYLGLGALHVYLDELDRRDTVAAADVVQRIGADCLLVVQQRIRIDAIVALVLRILVKRECARAIRSRKLADERSAPRRSVALYRLLQ